MLSPTHPGVYIEEIPNPATIQGASTSIAAFVGIVGNVQHDGKGNYLPTAKTPTLVTSWLDYVAKFGGVAWKANVSLAVSEFLQRGGKVCYVVAVSTGSESCASIKLGSSPTTSLNVYGASPGKWPVGLISILVESTGPLLTVSVLAVKSAKGTFADTILQRYVDINSFPPRTVGANNYVILEQYGGVNGDDETSLQMLASRINKTSAFIRVSPVPEKATLSAISTPYALSGGGDFSAGALDFTSAADTLAGIADVSLVALPDLATIADADQPEQIKKVLSTLCGQPPTGLNQFYIVDAPFDLGATPVTTLTNFRENLNSPNGALYAPWLDIYCSITGTVVPVPPSGAVASCYASTDINAGPQVAPAGVVNGALPSVVSLKNYFSTADQDTLNPHNVNAIRSLTNYGNVIYGARTLDSTGEWTYVPVRRNIIRIEKSLTEGLQWLAFQPNTATLRLRVIREVTAFLRLLWNGGALYGNSESEAFYVVCDETNNPPEAMRSGILYVDVGVAPVYPAEFVVIRLAQKSASPA